MEIFQLTAIKFLLVSILVFTNSFCLADTNEVLSWECSIDDNSTAENPFKTNLGNLMTSLAANVPRTGFYKTTAEQKSDKLYGLIQCRGDLSREDCANCTNLTTTMALRGCTKSKQVIIWLEWCFLRFSDENFFGKVEVSSMATANETDFEDPAVVSQGVVFMGQLASTAPYQPLMFQTAIFVVGVNGKRYGMAQCTRDISKSDCEKCLDGRMVTFRTTIEGKRRWEIHGASCSMWYRDYQFFSSNISMNQGTRRTSSRIGVEVAIAALVMFMLVKVI